MLLVFTLELRAKLVVQLITIAKAARAASCEQWERKSRCAQEEANFLDLKQVAIILDLYLLRILSFWEEPSVMELGQHLAAVALGFE